MSKTYRKNHPTQHERRARACDRKLRRLAKRAGTYASYATKED